MLIDWFTVAAQIVNFLILVWVLKRVLYGRIVGAIQARESTIAARVAQAETAEKAAAELLAVYQAKLKDFEQRHANMLAQVAENAEKQHAEMIERARNDVRALEKKWREDLEREQHAFLVDLRGRAAAEILTVVRRAVADLACMDVQLCTVRVFLDKIRGLDGEAWKDLGKGELSIRSAFDLPEDTRAEIQQTIEEKLHAPVRLQFERAPAIGLGLELRGNGRRIGWNFEAYLEAMEEDLRVALEENAGAAAGRG